MLHLDEATADLLVSGVAEEAGDEPTDRLSARRDALITAMQKATRPLRDDTA